MGPWGPVALLFTSVVCSVHVSSVSALTLLADLSADALVLSVNESLS